jgi:hypothetical protein
MITALIIIIVLIFVLLINVDDLRAKVSNLRTDIDHLHNRVIRYGEGKENLEDIKKIRGIIDEVNK